MRPSDRPILAEPIDRPAAPPFTVKLGALVHLNGAVPRGAPLERARPHPCKRCERLILHPNLVYCEPCAFKECPRCRGHDGRHTPKCPYPRRLDRRCRGCQERLDEWTPRAERYCDACKAIRCPECRAYAGVHRTRCLYQRRPRKPRLTEYRGLVSEAEILALYVEYRPRAIQVARRVLGRSSDAEDCVHDAVTWFLARRDFLRSVPGPRLFLMAVKHEAFRRQRSGWAKFIIPVDPEMLLTIETMEHPRRRAHTPPAPVVGRR
jgi:hypothetical protein